MSIWRATLIGLCASTLLLAACGRDNQYVAPPPPKVTVAKPVRQQVTRYLEATGNTAAVNSTDLIARVSGFLQEVSYEDGALVKKDADLFTIEPEPYKLKLEQSQGHHGVHRHDRLDLPGGVAGAGVLRGGAALRGMAQNPR